MSKSSGGFRHRKLLSGGTKVEGCLSEGAWSLNCDHTVEKSGDRTFPRALNLQPTAFRCSLHTVSLETFSRAAVWHPKIYERPQGDARMMLPASMLVSSSTPSSSVSCAVAKENAAASRRQLYEWGSSKGIPRRPGLYRARRGTQFFCRPLLVSTVIGDSSLSALFGCASRCGQSHRSGAYHSCRSPGLCGITISVPVDTSACTLFFIDSC